MTHISQKALRLEGSSYASAQPVGAEPASRKPSYSTHQAAEQLLRVGHRWKDQNLDGTTSISYRFFTPSDTTYNTPAGANEFTANQKQQARRAMQSWSDVARLSFNENAPNAEGQLLLGNNAESGLSAYASYPGVYQDGTQAWFASGGKSRPFSHGSFSRYLLTHEIGHTLGLAHPGKYNGGGSYAEHARYAEDTRAYSVMSYWWEGHTGHNHTKNRRTHYPSAPMLHDIYTTQRLYGANFETRNTDTVYGFNSNTDRDFLSLYSPQDAPLFCVWDGGGNDTLDFSGFHHDQRIDVREGHFSDIGGMKGNVSIAWGVTLENAIGGTGNDHLIGNHVANRMTGGRGADTMTGGLGNDTFVYNHASDSTLEQPDLIMDFTSGQDKIDVSAALQAAGVNYLDFVWRFSGRPGEAVLGYDAQTRQYSLAIDLDGSGRADLFIKSYGQIKPGDVISQGLNTVGTAGPTRTAIKPAPPSQPPTPAPRDTPPPRPNTAAQQAPFSVQNWSSASLKGTSMYASARAVGSIREVTVMRDSWGYERVHYRSLGTGSLINDGNSVLTNQHVHEALAKGSRLELWLGHEQDSDGRMKVERKVPLSLTPLNSDARLDYAELRVDLPPAQKTALARQFPPLKLARRQVVPGQKVFMPNHGQVALGISFLNADGQPTTLKGYSNDMAVQGAFYHDAYKVPGTSGSPLISAETGEIVALHNGSIIGAMNGRRESMGTATPIHQIQRHRDKRGAH